MRSNSQLETSRDGGAVQFFGGPPHWFADLIICDAVHCITALHSMPTHSTHLSSISQYEQRAPSLAAAPAHVEQSLWSEHGLTRARGLRAKGGVAKILSAQNSVGAEHHAKEALAMAQQSLQPELRQN